MSAACTAFGRSIRHDGPAPYRARSASDRNENWPCWMVVDAHGVNGIVIEGSLAKFFEHGAAIVVAQALNDAVTA